MHNPRKRNSQLISDLGRELSALESNRIRTSMILAARIGEALRKKGWSKVKLAAALEKKPSVITKWLSGTHNFTSDTLSDISQILEIELILLNSVETKSQFSAIVSQGLTVNIFKEIRSYSEFTEGQDNMFETLTASTDVQVIKSCSLASN